MNLNFLFCFIRYHLLNGNDETDDDVIIRPEQVIPCELHCELMQEMSEHNDQ